MIRHDSRVARPVLENHRHPPPSSARAHGEEGKCRCTESRATINGISQLGSLPAFPAAYFCASLASARSCFAAAAAGVLFSWLSSERMRFYGMQLHPHRVDLQY